MPYINLDISIHSASIPIVLSIEFLVTLSSLIRNHRIYYRIHLMPSCWILMAFNCLKQPNQPTIPISHLRLIPPSHVAVVQSLSWIVSTIVLNFTLCWLRSWRADPLIGHFWTQFSQHPQWLAATWLNSTQIWFWFMLHANTTTEWDWDREKPNLMPESCHPKRFELITLASIGRFHIYMLLTRALACNGNWVSRSSHERVGQMDRFPARTILNCLADRPNARPPACLPQSGSVLFRSNNWKLRIFFWNSLFVLFGLCQDSFKHPQLEPVPGPLSNTLSIEKHNFRNLCLSFHLYRCMSVVIVVVLLAVVVES